MNINMLDLILLLTTVVFALITIYLIASSIWRRKTVIKALENSQSALKTQLFDNESALKNTLKPLVNANIEKKTAELIAIERDTYKHLIHLYVDYHPAAIEMMPSLVNQIIGSYIQCIEHIMQHVAAPSASGTEHTENEVEDLPDNFQYESLIEQLRYEKQDFANKYKDASRLLKMIGHQYQDQLKLHIDDSLEHMNLGELAQLFQVEFTPTES